ncbi:conserved protein of unknown function [Paraburkholderia dioscoreae]|uniref:Uncharacterized protein n=1 Tax=Paraburkholderia dioscoreae TaxID=2604047 RepID=A0A5Q4YVW6_9BURK|nr:conserved protein of unknown function [Paraburkholderia dioscoreae]
MRDNEVERHARDLVLFLAPLKWREKTFSPIRPADIWSISSYLQVFASAHKIGSNVD